MTAPLKPPNKLQMLLLMGTMFFIQACGGGGAGTNVSGTISGIVTAPESVSLKPSRAFSKPFQAPLPGTVVVPGAVCTLAGTDKSSLTDENGFFQIADVASGSYIVICKKTVADGNVFSFLVVSEVLDGQTTDLGTIQITQSGNIQGKATLAGQSDHTGIKIFIPGTSMQATTDALGAYLMSDIPDGIYDLHFEKTGFVSVTLPDVVVTSGQTTIAGDVNLNISAGATGSITIENGQDHFNSKTVTVSITASVDAVLYQLSEDPNFVGSVWNSIPSSTTWTFDSDGDKRLFIKFSDANGLESSPVSHSIIVDTTPPTGTGVTINIGASFTFSLTGTLNLTASDLTTSVTQMKISNDPVLTGALWEPFASTRSWTFIAAEGTKTVFVKFMDVVGNESEIVSASITFTSLTSIEVSPANSSLAVGFTQQFIATGASTNGNTQDLTASVNWSSLDPLVATVTAGGLVTGVSLGATTITATDTLTSIAGSTKLTIAWTTKAPMPTARYGMGIGVVNDLLYTLGGIGEHAKGALATIEAYNPTTDTWTTKMPMPTARIYVAAGVIDNVIYAVGGYDAQGSVFAAVEAYDPATDTWTIKAPMPTARYSHTVAVANGILYAMGGFKGDGTFVSPPIEAYDPTTNTWTAKAPMPTDRYHLTASEVSGLLYAVGGGENGVDVLATVEAYDSATDIWTTKAPMPTARYTHAATIVNDILYAIGGHDARGGVLGTVEAYDPATDTWTTKASMHTARQNLSAGVIKNVIYAVGGFNENGPLDTVEAFTPP